MNQHQNGRNFIYDVVGKQGEFTYEEVRRSSFLRENAKRRMPLAVCIVDNESETPFGKKLTLSDILLFNQEMSKGDDVVYKSLLGCKRLNLKDHLIDSKYKLEFIYDQDFIDHVQGKISSIPKGLSELIKDLFENRNVEDFLKGQCEEESVKEKEVEPGDFSTLFEQDLHFYDPNTNSDGFIPAGTILPKIITQNWSFYLDQDALNEFKNSRP